MPKLFCHQKTIRRFIKIESRRKGGKEIKAKRIKETNEEEQKEER